MMGSMMRRAMLGDGSTLNVDFTLMTNGGHLANAGFTFTNATTAARTYINASGIVATATTNEPRFDYDPTTRQPRGLLIEGAASNVLQHSVAVDQSPWFAAGGVTRTTFTGGIGPDGVNNSGSKMSAVNISSSSSLYYNGVSFTSGTTYTYSVWAKADGANWIWISLHIGGAQHGAFFDLSGNGALGNTTGTVVSGSNTITKYSNGWFRLTVSHTAASTSMYFPVLLPCTSNGTGYASIAGQSPNGVLVYGAQLETGSGASSYIPTVASTVTRLADTAIIAAGAAFTSWYTGDTSGTFYADWHGGVRSTTGTNRTVLSTSDVVNRHFHLMQTAAAGNLRVSDFGASSSVTTANAMTSGARTKGAFSFNLGSVKLCLNGGTVASGSVLFTTAPTYLVIGGTSTNGTSITDANVLLNGCVRQIKYWPTILPDAQLQSITT